jgi:hypothetical protein
LFWLLKKMPNAAWLCYSTTGSVVDCCDRIVSDQNIGQFVKRRDGTEIAHAEAGLLMPTPRIASAVRQLTGMFVDQPERQLSLAEAVCLTGLDGPACQIVLETLQDARFLARTDDGRFGRSDRSPGSLPDWRR